MLTLSHGASKVVPLIKCPQLAKRRLQEFL